MIRSMALMRVSVDRGIAAATGTNGRFEAQRAHLDHDDTALTVTMQLGRGPVKGIALQRSMRASNMRQNDRDDCKGI